MKEKYYSFSRFLGEHVDELWHREAVMLGEVDTTVAYREQQLEAVGAEPGNELYRWALAELVRLFPNPWRLFTLGC